MFFASFCPFAEFFAHFQLRCRERACPGSVPSWLPCDLDVSDSSSDDDEAERPPGVAPTPLVGQDVRLQAAWDLLLRPAGISACV